MGRELSSDFASPTAPRCWQDCREERNRAATGQGGISKHERPGSLQQPPIILHQLPPVLQASTITLGASFSSASLVGLPCP